MDENISWKIVYIAAIFSLIVLGLVYYRISPRESEFFSEGKTEKIAEFKSTRFSGRKDGQKKWEFFAEEGWTAKDRQTTHLQKVLHGKIFQDGKVIVFNLSAPTAIVYSPSEIVEATGPLKTLLNLGRISNPTEEKPEEWTRMTANSLKYFPQEKRTEMRQKVKLHKEDSSIYAEEIYIDHEKRTADIKGEISLKRKDAVLHSDNMRYISPQEKLEAQGNVDLKIQEGLQKTNLKCAHASFFTDVERDMILQGSLEATQGKKFAVAEEGLYSQKRRELIMRKNARVVFEKALAILKGGTAKKLKNPEAKKILKEKTVLISDKLILSTWSGDARASGSVFVSQKEREAKADYAEYDEKKEILTLSGNVYMKRGTVWVKAKQVIVSIKNETFEAIGAVEAEFKL